jgi:Ran GTPase-activating protein (RanGAP) involved in mRNA processing and transport
MAIKYNLGQRFVISVLLISLFLQSCSQFSNPLIPIIEEAQGSGGGNQPLDSQELRKELEDKNLITQGENQKDIQTPQLDISIIDKEKKSYSILNKPIQTDVIMPKSFELATITSTYSQETGIQMNQRGLIGGVKKVVKTLIGGVKKVAKTKQEPTKDSILFGSALGKFDILPGDLLPGILSYLESKELGQVSQLNKSFYKFTTGYERPGMVGVKNKPSANCLVLGLNTHRVDFKKVEGLNPETISSFAFYRLMGEVRNLPAICWAHRKGTSILTIDLRYNQIGDSGAAEFAKNLHGTSVHTINLRNNQIGDSGAAELAKNLQGTNVRTIYLWSNQIGALGAAEFAKNLKGTNVHTIYLIDNQIGALGAAWLAKNLHSTSVHTIDLSINQIGALGAAEFAKNLQGTSAHTIDLSLNQIGDSGAAEFAKNLQGTSVRIIYLRYNQIGDLGVAELAKNLQGTSVHTVNLNNNQIGASGTAEFAKNLQGTNVHTIDLSDNRIGNLGAAEFVKNLQGTRVHIIALGSNQISASGAAEFAKNLQGTSVHMVNLEGNDIGYETQNLLKQQYTNIQWSF